MALVYYRSVAGGVRVKLQPLAGERHMGNIPTQVTVIHGGATSSPISYTLYDDFSPQEHSSSDGDFYLSIGPIGAYGAYFRWIRNSISNYPSPI